MLKGFVAKVSATIEKRAAAELVRDWQAGQENRRITRREKAYVSLLRGLSV
jgi:hypothetical protein